MKLTLGAMMIVVLLSSPLMAVEDVSIQTGGDRMKASIPDVSEGGPAPSVNWVYQGVGAVAQGTYFVAKAAVDVWGKGTDLAVESVQDVTGKSYQMARKPFQKKEHEKK
jgi:hypothetical protein